MKPENIRYHVGEDGKLNAPRRKAKEVDEQGDLVDVTYTGPGYLYTGDGQMLGKYEWSSFSIKLIDPDTPN